MTTGKSLVNDKATLLRLANDIADKKEHAVRIRVSKTRAAIVSSRQVKKTSDFTSSKSNISSSSAKLRAAKQLVAGRRAKQKREKTRARKLSDGQQIVRSDPGSIGDGLMNNKLSQDMSPNSMPLKATTRRVAFA